MRLGEVYKTRMEAKDGSAGFDFEATYNDICELESFSYEFGGRNATVVFKDVDGQTEIKITFDSESENPVELQKQGWQSILNNFKNYIETRD
ncbi:SRPBCC domain-containing protein [Candidatus Nomurabacteria bacterium]|nr:SRPBCC domain-containing protein [Candidatus Nomurabacteria bacterium]